MVATTTPQQYNSVPDLEKLRRTYAKCKYKRYYPDGRPCPCRSQRCPCEACRVKYAQKEAAILRRSFRDKPPDFNFTLRLKDDKPTSDKELATYLKRLTQRIRDLRKAEQAAFDYYINVEFKNGEPHMHMTVITSLVWSVYAMKKMMKWLWSESCVERQATAVYCDRVHSVVGLANYLPKNLKDRRKVEMPPNHWNSKACRLVWKSRGFLTKNKQDLWNELRQEWYPRSQPHEVSFEQERSQSPCPSTTRSCPSDCYPEHRQDRCSIAAASVQSAAVLLPVKDRCGFGGDVQSRRPSRPTSGGRYDPTCSGRRYYAWLSPLHGVRTTATIRGP